MSLHSCIFIFLLTVSVRSTTTVTRAVQFKQIKLEPWLSIKPSGLQNKTDTQLQCAIRCVSTNSCASFYYDKTSRNCSLGTWLLFEITNVAPLTGSGKFYSIRRQCNLANGFQIMTSRDVTVCVYISPDRKNYIEARDFCKQQNASLFTPKNPDKLAIFLRIGSMGQERVWCGLDRMETLETFRWVDDGSELSSSWKTSLFQKDEPNNKNGKEYCVDYYEGYDLLNDDDCSLKHKYVCEQL